MSPESRDLSRLRIEKKDQEGSTAGGSLKLFFVVLFSMMVFGGGGYLWGVSKTSSDASRQPVQANSSVTSKNVEASRPPPPANSLDATGYVVAQRKAAVSSKATGRLQQLLVKEGDVVADQQLIAVLENADAKASVDEHEASLAAARSRVKTSSAELEDAKRQFERFATLKNSGAVSQTDRDAIEARFRKASAAVEASKSDIVVEEARVEKAKVEFEFTLIRAPFAGTVLTKNADVGEVVAPFGSAANARGAVVTLADMDSLQVEADVSEANLSKVKVGQQCVITLDSYPDKKYRGEVSSIVPTVDRAKGTVTVKIRFLDKDTQVIPEMSAKVSFQLS